MYKTITENSFISAFDECNRGNNFSYEGRKALFNYLEEIDLEQELDVIALCCEFVEYANEEEYLKEYSTDLEQKDFDTLEDFYQEVRQEIQDKTQFIDIDGESFIIQAY
jgi:hypothetical protein